MKNGAAMLSLCQFQPEEGRKYWHTARNGVAGFRNGRINMNPKRAARGSVIIVKQVKRKGATASLLVQRGTLHVGEFHRIRYDLQ